MKKQLIIALAFSIGAFSFAQKKELKAVQKAINNSNFSEAKAGLTTLESMLGSLDEKSKDKYHYLNAQALFANGTGSFKDMSMAERSLEKVGASLKKEVGDMKFKMFGEYLKKANKQYENKKYKPASFFFEKTYNLSPKDTIYLYYAAFMATKVPDYKRALGLYEKLKDLNYDGRETNYFAVSNKTNKKESFPSKQLRNLAVGKTHSNPSEEKTESRRAEIVKNVALIHISNGNNDEAIKAIQDARAEDPNDVNLILSEANIHYKTGNTAKFKELLQVAIEKDPKNPELQYNLGVISSESNQIEEALAYYKKAIELDPNYINAYINSAAVLLSKEKSLIEEMNGLGSSAKDDKRYDVLRKQRQNLYRDAIPFLTKALEIDPKNSSAATTLMNIYSVLNETDKYKAMKAKLEAMGGQ